ncbi:hypothetical protein ACOMHN_026355 [Nucella lapillus]
MGDFNTKTGSENRGYVEIKVHQGLGEMSDSGQRFADLCHEQPVTGGSFFHHRIHKATRVSPAPSTENQADPVCIRKILRSRQ